MKVLLPKYLFGTPGMSDQSYRLNWLLLSVLPFTSFTCLGLLFLLFISTGSCEYFRNQFLKAAIMYSEKVILAGISRQSILYLLEAGRTSPLLTT